MSKSAIIISDSSVIARALQDDWRPKGYSIRGTYRYNYPKEFRWNILVFCAGVLKPFVPFESTWFQNWRESVNVNFIKQMEVLRELLPYRRTDATVLFFGGGGTNSAPKNCSAYTVSKIALLKMCELLDAEIDDCKFVMVGPGFHKTKMTEGIKHSGKTCSMDKVVECCNWIIGQEKSVVGGRNISVVHDYWDKEWFGEMLKADSSACKLRREE